MSNGPLIIRLLGEPHTEMANGQSGPSLPRKGWGIFALLATRPGVSQTRERLAGWFWPDLEDKAARNNLRQVLLTLARILDEDHSHTPTIVADRRTVRLNPACRHKIDLVAFNQTAAGSSANIAALEDAAALYRDDLLLGYHLGDCHAFEDWLAAQREALHRRALSLIQRLCWFYETQNNLKSALDHAYRFVTLEPWDEDGQRRLIRLLALSGQRNAALNQFETCRRILEQELGVLPEDETRALVNRIQHGDIHLDTEQSAAPSEMPPMASERWERRQVTVLYCQLASPSMDDPEDFLETLRETQAGCERIVHDNDGHVVRTNEGGLLAYFGLPRASEHAAQRAVRTGLKLTSQRLRHISLRIGIHTGLMIVGDDQHVPDMTGRTSGEAVRLQGFAQENQVVVSTETQRLAAGYFQWEAVGDVYRAVRESGATHRLAAAQTLSPLVGRQRETDVLRNHWQAVQQGNFRTLLLVGDPGIGKSRLAGVLKNHVTQTGGIARELRCLPEHSQTPFRPLIDFIAALSGFTSHDSPATRFDKLVTYFEKHRASVDVSKTVPMFAALLDLPVGKPFRPLQIPQQAQRDRIMSVMCTLLSAFTKDQPLLLVIEDLHWIDPTSLELLNRIIANTQSSPLFVLGTARPEFTMSRTENVPPIMMVGGLDDNDVMTLIGAQNRDISSEAVRDIVAKADGVPLFAEELTRAAHEATSEIPATLQDLLAARLDGVAEARDIAQLAATVGREFSSALLRAVSSPDTVDVDDALLLLCSTGLVTDQGDDLYTFRHALFQDAVYHAQTRHGRRSTHCRIAETLQSRFPDVVRRQPEVLAHHWGAGDESDKAITYWIQAGRRANQACAYQEAISRFSSGLALINKIDDEERKIHLEFDLQVGLGAACFATGGYASPQAANAYGRGVELGERHSGNPDLFNALWGLWACTSSRTDYDDSLQLTLRLLRMAEKGSDLVRLQQGHFAVGNIQFWRGEFTRSREHLEKAMSLYRPEHHDRFAVEFGENAYVTSGAYLAWTLCFLGYPDQADEVAQKALDEARRIDHPFSLGYTLTLVTVLQRLLRRPEKTLRYADETIALAEEHGFPLWIAGATHIRGWALACLGHLNAIGPMRQGIASVTSLMNGIKLIFLETLAETLCICGAYKEALTIIGQGWDCVTVLGDHHVEAELHRLEGVCAMAMNDDEVKAEASFQKALDIARGQQAKLLELRATKNLAALWHHQGRTDEARKILSDMLEKLTEGFSTPEVVEARALLDGIDG